jgi:hypothetical protein
MTHLDGNGAAGVLREIFAAQMTGSSCTCASCRRVSAIGGLLLYGGAMGTVLRCPTCQAVVLRVTQTRRRWTLEIRGLVRIDRTESEPDAAL